MESFDLDLEGGTLALTFDTTVSNSTADTDWTGECPHDRYSSSSEGFETENYLGVWGSSNFFCGGCVAVNDLTTVRLIMLNYEISSNRGGK